MKPTIDPNLHAPSFFTPATLLKLLQQAEKTGLRNQLDEEIDKCNDLTHALMETVPDAENPEAIERQCETVNTIADQLSYIQDLLYVADMLRQNKLYSWHIPKDADGYPNYEKKITTTAGLTPFNYTRDVLAAMKPMARSPEMLANSESLIHAIAEEEKSNPAIMFFDQPFDALKKPKDVGEIMEQSIAEPEDFDHSIFNEAIDFLKEAHHQNEALLTIHGSALPEILAFFDSPAVAKLRTPSTIYYN